MERGGSLPIIVPLLEDKEGAPIDELDDHILLLEAARHRLEVEFTESVGVFEEREGHRVHGHPSMVAYLKDRAQMAGSRAHRYVSMARLARRFKATFSSWKHRLISSDQADTLFQAARRTPDRYTQAEPVLLEIAGDTPEETRRMLDYWRNTVDREGVAGDEDAMLRRRRLDWTRKPTGMIEGDFALTPLVGEAFITAMDALMPPPDPDDARTATQRRHDALGDLARNLLDSGTAPQVGGEKPHLNVLVDLDALEGIGGGLHETETGRVFDVDTLRQLTCDSTVSRIVRRGESEILDVGRRTRVVPAALRRAVIARDRRCAWRGCTRAPRWCDIHHIISWAEGGETVLSNLCLLCRYHHTLIHRHEGPSQDLLDLPISPPASVHRPS